MRAVAAPLLVLGAAAAPVTAAELKVVTAFTPVMMEQIYRLPRSEAEAMFVDTTIRGRVGAIEEDLRARLPFAGDMIVYFAPDGDVLVWSDKSAVVETGYWELIASGGTHDLCIRFGHFGLDSLCASVEAEHSDWIVETTPGNPFALVAGTAIPAQLAGGELSLQAIASRLP
jgi:hypothetical protein